MVHRPRHTLFALLLTPSFTHVYQAPLLFGSGATMPPYTVFIDAGSTGSRIHTFAVGGQEQRVQSAHVSSAAPSTWKQASHAQGAFSLHPACEPVALQTPLSALADAATGASPPAAWTYLQPLVDHVETKCVTERQQQAETPFHVWATAGMRVLAPAAQSAVYAAVGTALAGHTEFQLTSREKNDDDGDSVGTPCCATIDGESEGFFAWLAVNTLSGSADFSRVHTTADVAAVVRTTMGALDLGGGSTQVVMAAPPKEGRERVQRGAQPRKALVSDTDAPIAALRDVAYVRTVLGAGAVALESRVKHSLTAQRDTGGNVSNPCSFPGYDERVPATADATTITVVGAGNFESCTTLVHAALAELETPPRPLPFTQGGEQPDGPRFVALSLFYHVAHFLAVAMRPTTEADAEQVATRLLSPPPPFAFPNPTPGELAARCAVLCALPWHVVENHLGGVDPNTPPPRLHGRCFDCALVSTLLSASDVGYGFPRDSRAIVFLDKIHNTTVEWTLGAAIATLHPASLATRNASRRANAVSGVVLLLAAGSAFASAMVKSTSTSDPSQCSAVDD